MTLRYLRYLIQIASLVFLGLTSIAHAQTADDVVCSQCIDTGDIAREAVARARLADQAVSKEKLADRAVTSAKIASKAVSTGKLGRAAVTNGKIADGAVSEEKLSDELATQIAGSLSGAASTTWTNSLITTSTTQVAVQDSINVPAPGVIIAMATGYVFHAHTTGTEDNTVIHLDDVAGTTDVNGIGTTEVRTPAAVPTGNYHAVPYSITRTFPAASAGTQTIYVNCRKTSGVSDGWCYGNHLTLLYVATSL